MKEEENRRTFKILELTNFSAGICGVWQRVKQESQELARRGHQVSIFSSNSIKGSDETARTEDRINKIKIRRFPFRKIGGESFMFWFGKDAEREALEFSPDIIIAHSYRHPHTIKALKTAKKLREQGKNCRVFLVTHAPFVEKNLTRSFFEKLAVKFYDKFVGPKTISQFDKVISITKWEIPYLLELEIIKEKISYIPNGIPEEFLKKNLKKGEIKKILFLGRISPIKNLEILIKAVYLLNDKEIILSIVGHAEKDYKLKLLDLIRKLKLGNQIKIYPAVYDLNKKIGLIDESEIFVLPSKREAMPQALIEAMARGKIVISSKTKGGEEIISPEKDGFLFQIGNQKQLAEIINKVQNLQQKEKQKIKKQAQKTAKKFSWRERIKDLECLF